MPFFAVRMLKSALQHAIFDPNEHDELNFCVKLARKTFFLPSRARTGGFPSFLRRGGSVLSQNACSFSTNNVRRRHILQCHGCTTRFPVSPHRCTRDVRHVLDAPRVGMTRICEIAARYLLGGSARTIFRAVTVGATQFFHSSSSAWSLDLFPKRKKVKIIFSGFFKINFQKNGMDPHIKPNFVPKHGFLDRSDPVSPAPAKKITKNGSVSLVFRFW